jgi:hypothetical protein
VVCRKVARASLHDLTRVSFRTFKYRSASRERDPLEMRFLPIHVAVDLRDEFHLDWREGIGLRYLNVLKETRVKSCNSSRADLVRDWHAQESLS